MKYIVEVTREADFWEADVLKVEGAHTFARNLKALDRYVREVIALAEDLPEGVEPTLSIEYRYKKVTKEFLAAAAIGERRAALEAEQAELASRASAAASTLLDAGIPVRDVSVALHMSPGRVSQIAGQRVRKAS